MKRSLPAVLALLIFILLPAIARAREYTAFGPITTRNQNPVYLQNIGLTPTRADTLPEGTLEMRIDSAYSNLFERAAGRTAFLDLDMEYWRIAPFISYGATDDLEIGVEIPFVHLGGGFLDAFIQKFHSFFHLPNGGRDTVPNGRFSYRFDAGGRTLLDYPTATLGLGDVLLHCKQQLAGETAARPAIMLFADLKFPTGQPSRGFGSGGFDVGAGVALEKSYKRLHGYANVACYGIGGNEAIDRYMYGGMLAYTVAGELTLLPDWSLIVQLDGSTPLLDGTGIEDWDGVPLDLVVGFRGQESKLIGGQDFFWQFGFSEDVTSRGPSVDFTVFASVGIRFDTAGRSRPQGDWLARKP